VGQGHSSTGLFPYFPDYLIDNIYILGNLIDGTTIPGMVWKAFRGRIKSHKKKTFSKYSDNDGRPNRELRQNSSQAQPHMGQTGAVILTNICANITFSTNVLLTSPVTLTNKSKKLKYIYQRFCF